MFMHNCFSLLFHKNSQHILDMMLYRRTNEKYTVKLRMSLSKFMYYYNHHGANILVKPITSIHKFSVNSIILLLVEIHDCISEYLRI
jgi:hypothetical protein